MPARRHVGKRRATAAAVLSSRARGSSSAAALPPPPPPLFFSLARATLRAPMERTKVVAVTMPMASLHDKAALHEHVLRKLLHKPYALERDDATATTATSPQRAHNDNDDNDNDDNDDTSTLTVVHVDAIEVHVDTIRQANAHGDVQMNVMLTLGLARVQHGLFVSVAEASPYAGCMQVWAPVADAFATTTTATTDAQPHSAAKRGQREAQATAMTRHTDAADTNSAAAAADAAAAVVDTTATPSSTCVRVTLRCPDEEPVVVGQAVLVVSEPGGGGMRCLAIRPPRRAPAPFALHDHKQHHGGSGSNGDDAAAHADGGTRRHDKHADAATRDDVEVVLLHETAARSGEAAAHNAASSLSDAHAHSRASGVKRPRAVAGASAHAQA